MDKATGGSGRGTHEGGHLRVGHPVVAVGGEVEVERGQLHEHRAVVVDELVAHQLDQDRQAREPCDHRHEKHPQWMLFASLEMAY